MSILREFSKAHEQVYRGSARELLAQMSADANMGRGEIVFCIGPDTAKTTQPDGQRLDKILQVLLAEVSLHTAIKIATQLTGLKRNQVYSRALELASDDAGADTR